MVTRNQVEGVAHAEDDGWRVMPTMQTGVRKPSGNTIMLRIENDIPHFVMVGPDGKERQLEDGELQRWWDGQ